MRGSDRTWGGLVSRRRETVVLTIASSIAAIALGGCGEAGERKVGTISGLDGKGKKKGAKKGQESKRAGKVAGGDRAGKKLRACARTAGTRPEQRRPESLAGCLTRHPPKPDPNSPSGARNPDYLLCLSLANRSEQVQKKMQLIQSCNKTYLGAG